nr:MAG: replication initiation protein [Microviridae sp.]
MCNNKLKIVNPHYKKLAPVNYNDLYGGRDDFYLLVPCGKCPECRSRKGASWRVRLIKECELGNHRHIVFCTLTFDESSISKVERDPGTVIREFCESYREYCRKKFPKRRKRASLRHWFVIEYGEKKGRIHFHGLIFDPLLSFKELESLWKFGFSDFSTLKSTAGATYVTKYITKSQSHIGKYSGRVFVSPGFGACYLTPESHRLHRSSLRNSGLIFVNNFKYCLPRYFRNKIFTDDERKVLNKKIFDRELYRVMVSSAYRAKFRQEQLEQYAKNEYYKAIRKQFYDLSPVRIDSLKMFSWSLNPESEFYVFYYGSREKTREQF